MPSGKSLELRDIKPTPSWKCLCGAAWNDHLKKNGELKVRFQDDTKHRPLGGEGPNRALRRRKFRGR